MQKPDFFCNECGAANPRDAAFCFACKQALDLPSSTPDTSSTPAAPTSSEPMQIQINLSSGSMTMFQIQQPQAMVNLLHERYQVMGKVGTGGFGAVYKARDTHNRNRLVAIKSIALDTLSAAQSIEATDTFNRELSLLSTLEHPNLPHIHEHFTDATHWYLVMNFIDGEPLDEYLQQIAEGRLPLAEVMEIALQLCDVLQYLHQCKPPIIFRDVKPANIILTPGGRLYLIDFGIARRFKPGQSKDTTPLGSPGFAAPEQYGKTQTTTRSDIYSLGATLYFLLTGYDPANSSFNLPPICSQCPELPTPLAQLITSMLALNPSNRPASMATVRTALLSHVPPTSPQLATPVRKTLSSAPTRRQHLSSIAYNLVMVIIIIILLGICIFSSYGHF